MSTLKVIRHRGFKVLEDVIRERVIKVLNGKIREPKKMSTKAKKTSN